MTTYKLHSEAGVGGGTTVSVMKNGRLTIRRYLAQCPDYNPVEFSILASDIFGLSTDY